MNLESQIKRSYSVYDYLSVCEPSDSSYTQMILSNLCFGFLIKVAVQMYLRGMLYSLFFIATQAWSKKFSSLYFISTRLQV